MKGKDYFRELIGAHLIEVKDGYAKVTMKISQQHLNFVGVAHGGAIFSLADCAFAEAANTSEKVAVAIQISINYVRPTFEGDELTAEATRMSESKTFGLYNIIIRKEEKTVAIFQGLVYKQ